ncbi:uncharacterized protein LOC133886391 [Phragmites australis]|uniref:uncharacterized protein LOC133886391 n=1 Tax=Phragmites australis TaxID=29695 RepID=UPI002D772DBC|nr:uncharacterized protein LOC133886391 [Phragmites australis]
MARMGVNATVLLLVLAALACCHAGAAGNGEQGGCQLSDIKVSQEKTRKVVEGQPEYRVTIENLCPCPQAYVNVHCNGLPSVEPIDSSKIKVEDELCMVASEMFKGSPVTFTYAWKTPQDFAVVSAEPQC